MVWWFVKSRYDQFPKYTFSVVSHHFPLQKYAPVLEPFCESPKTQVALINVVQVYCYEDTRVMRAFPQILKVCI